MAGVDSVSSNISAKSSAACPVSSLVSNSSKCCPLSSRSEVVFLSEVWPSGFMGVGVLWWVDISCVVGEQFVVGVMSASKSCSPRGLLTHLACFLNLNVRLEMSATCECALLSPLSGWVGRVYRGVRGVAGVGGTRSCLFTLLMGGGGWGGV